MKIDFGTVKDIALLFHRSTQSFQICVKEWCCLHKTKFKEQGRGKMQAEDSFATVASF